MLIGVISIYRQEVRPFTDKQIELVKHFAAQAVIAIESTRLLNELRQSLEQQTATAEVLSVISSSPGELKPVFESMLENAVRICEAKFGTLQLCENGAFHVAAMHNPPPAYAEARRSNPLVKPSPHNALGRVIATKRLVHIPDYTQEIAYKQGDPAAVSIVELAGARTFVIVPMLKDDELIGNLVLYRQEVKPFTDKQIELLENFAAQAVIAIENTRLLNELRQRTDDLTESLEQQVATSDVLRVISSSPGELVPVFQAMLENAVRICEAAFGSMLLREGDGFRRVALHNAPLEYAKFGETKPLLPPTKTLARIMETMQAAQVADMAVAEPQSPISRLGGARTLLNVPMIKENELIGVFAVFRQEVRPFTDKQIDLVKNFAAQAVIAIENTRLLNELRESLEQQTATSEVLGVISCSPGELEPVFQSMLENATRICEAKFGVLNLYENGALRMGAMHNVPPAFAEWLQNQRGGYRPIPGSPLDNVIRTKQLSVTADHAAEAAPGRATTLGGARSTVCVPMIKDEQLVGTITIYRQEVRPFTDKQSALLTNFAAQAVIAIENTRLLNELRQRTTDLTESLEQQTATADVLRVISSSPGNLEPVFEAMLENAARVCDAKSGNIFRWDGGLYHHVAAHNAPVAFAETRRGGVAYRPDPVTPLGRVLASKSVVHIADLAGDEAYLEARHPRVVQAVELGGVHTALVVPMLKDGGTHRCVHNEPRRSPPVHRTADRVGAKLRCTSRHRHREHAAA